MREGRKREGEGEVREKEGEGVRETEAWRGRSERGDCRGKEKRGEGGEVRRGEGGRGDAGELENEEKNFNLKTGINVYYKYKTKDHKHLPIILDARLRGLFCQEASVTNLQEHVKLC